MLIYNPSFKDKMLEILNNRLYHHALHNETSKDIRIDEVKILKGIIKDNSQS